MQGKFTIPKLELNAFTLAARLTNWILNELQPSLDIQGVYVFVRNLSVEINNISNDIAEKVSFVRCGYVVSGDNPADCTRRRYGGG
ncbi:unnamed protein product [Heligmosomoides polygyrus]|uniref:Uncharacterized protein n=1 Tax=Heligmosomoides polygyrus TaxID=6339 RepID=A0A183FAF3_HELPZ|nr:unnamed protein product [Heligmosomoides polygyrus]